MEEQLGYSLRWDPVARSGKAVRQSSGANVGACGWEVKVGS